MTGLKKSSCRFVLLLLISLFAAIFYGCVEVPYHCGEGNRLNPETEFCYEGRTYKKCAGGEYNPVAEFCSGNTVHERCGGSEYNLTTQMCDAGVVRPYVKRFTVTFNTNGGTPATITPIMVDTGTTISTARFPTPPTREGHIFDGWFEGTTQYTAATIITANIALVARWTPAYTVSFNTDGGTPAIAPVTVVSGSSMGVNFPANPTKTGYVFGGWFLGTTQYTATTVITASVTLTAKWTEIPPNVTVSFDTDGGTPETILPITIDGGASLGAKFPVVDPTKTGHTFDGWFDGTTQYTAATIITANITLVARWTPIPQTVSFNTNGGSPATIASVTVDYGTSLGTNLPANPTKTGHNFVGWFVGEIEYIATTVITAEVTLTAKWEIRQLTVAFDVNGGSPAPTTPVTVNHGASLGTNFPATEPIRTGHTFGGWFDGTTRYTATTPITANVTLVARWTPIPQTVTFLTDGGTPSVAPITIGYGSSLGTQYPQNPSKAGYAFSGWFDSEGTQYTATTIITDNITLTARWTPAYTVSFDTDGGTPAIAPVTVIADSSIRANFPASPTKSGYTFLGWFNGDTQYTASTIITANVTLVARWTPAQVMCLYNNGACWPTGSVAFCNDSWGWVFNGGLAGGDTYCAGGTYNEAATTNRRGTPPPSQ